MKARVCAVALLVAGLSVAAFAGETEPAAGGAEFTMTESLQAMLDARDEKDAPVVDEDRRTYFDGIPAHAKQLFADAVEAEYIGSAKQLQDLLSLDLDTSRLELVLTNNCLLCHSNSEYQDPPTLFSLDPVAAGSPPYMDLRQFLNDTHFRHNLSCAGCHGGDPTGDMAHEHPDEWPADHDGRVADPKWVPEFCARCHSDTRLMGRFNPSLPTDQLAKYKESHHGKALLGGDNPRAAQCISCHGVHGIQAANNPASSVSAKRVPETCGKCHGDPEVMKGVTLADGSPIPTDQLEKYRTSVHGRALLENGDTGAPACNDCHGNHAAAPAEVSSVSQICRTCHARNGTLFDGSRHKQAFEKNGWPECEKCHSNHGIEKTNDGMLATTKGALCADCHDEHSRDKPECKETAAHFHDTIVAMAKATDDYVSVAEELAERGLDVEPLEEEHRNLDDALRMARSTVHSFDRSDFDEVAAGGKETMAKMDALVEAAETEYRERSKGLLIAVGFLVFLVLALWLKIRAMEQDQGGQD